MAKPKKGETKKPKTRCRACNGTGQKCDSCGEAEGSCDCDTTHSECPDCKGTGE